MGVLIGPDPNKLAGRPDTTFSTGVGFSSTSTTVLGQPDGKIVVLGTYVLFSGVSRNRIVRLNTDGSIDNTFIIGTGFSSETTCGVLQPDGKIVVGGFYTTYSGVTTNRIVRLNTNGSIDNTFNIGTGFNSNLVSMVLQPDGKIVAGGQFVTYSGVTRNRIIRLNTDGSIDNTFNIGTGFGSAVISMVLQQDGKIVVGGQFLTYSGVTTNRIVRLNTDGSIDNTFNTGTGFDNLVRSVAVQPDGKILLGGNFNSYSGVTRNRIIRLNTDGSIDNTFNIGTGFDNTVRSVALQSDGKIIVYGDYNFYNGLEYPELIRLNTDGSIDYNFLPRDGISPILFGTVANIYVDNSNNIFLVGQFTSYQGISYGRIVKIIGN